MKFAAASIVRISPLLMLLVSAWLLWSGLFKPLLLGLGAFSCLLVAYLTHRLGLHRLRKIQGEFQFTFFGLLGMARQGSCAFQP